MTTNEKIAVLRNAMQAAGANACVIPSSDPHISEYLPEHWQARRYFSGFTGSAGTLVVTDKGSALWTDGRYFVQAERQLEGSEVELQRMRMPGVPTVAEYLVREMEEGQVLAVDGKVCDTALVRSLEAALSCKNVTVKDVDLVEGNWPDRPAVPATEAWVLEERYSGEGAASKIDRLRKRLVELGASAQVVTRLDSLAWLTNLRGSDLDCTPYSLAWGFVSPVEAVVFINTARLPAAARAALEEQGIVVREYDELMSFLAAYTDRRTVLVDISSTNYAIYKALQENPAFTVCEKADPIQLMKGVKSEAELKNIRAAHVRDGIAMIRFQMDLEKKMAANETVTEWDITGMLYGYRSAQKDFLMESFTTIAAHGPHGAMMHYSATPESHSVLQHKGFLLVDSGAQYKDGTTDITRTYALGTLTDKEKWWYTLVLKSHIAMARCVFLEGCTGGNLDIIAREPLWKHGIDYRCGTGHGVGFVGGVHEGPQSLRITNDQVFVPGMTITDEPGVYETDQVGIRIESELVCVEKEVNQYGRFLAFEDFTYCPIDLTAVVPEMLDAGEKEWLNGYHKMVYDTLAPHITEEEKTWLAAKTAPLA